MIRGWIKDAGHVYFMTNTVRFWLPIFCFKDIIHLVYNTWEHYRQSKNIQYYSYVIMPDHLHYIVWIPEGSYTLSDFQRDFKKYLSRTAHRILLAPLLEIHPFFHGSLNSPDYKTILKKLSHYPKRGNHHFTLWRSDDIPEIIESESIFKQKMNYIHMNPVRKSLVDDICYYPFSSANKGPDNQFIVDKIY